MSERLVSSRIVSGGSVSCSVVTEDGGFAKSYPRLIEVNTECERWKSAYYFVDSSKADDFIASLSPFN